MTVGIYYLRIQIATGGKLYFFQTIIRRLDRMK